MVTKDKQLTKNIPKKGPLHHAKAPVQTDRPAHIPEVVTPSASRGPDVAEETESRNVRRALFHDEARRHPPAVTPLRGAVHLERPTVESSTRRKLLFGRLVNEVLVKENVRRVYKIVRSRTGSIGGNASSGPIYGELTMGSMQKVINAMVEHTGLDHTSRFIDVGSGIGKPNLHVTQDPGVEFSYGIEVDPDRWMLGMSCLSGVLEAASQQSPETEPNETVRHQCVFECGDISKAQSFDPFTHVYMFSCGFPPALWSHLAAMWNRSSSPYMVCYSGPRHMIADYGFHLELVAQLPTSMHGSKEGHTAYLYRRSPQPRPFDRAACDAAFRTAWDRVRAAGGPRALQAAVAAALARAVRTEGGPVTRARRGAGG